MKYRRWGFSHHHRWPGADERLANLSEIVLAQLACDPVKHRKRPRVLVGGLGMGFTLRAALDRLPADAAVVVAELNPIMVRWCRGPMVHLTGAAVDDPRVEVVIDDVVYIARQTSDPVPSLNCDERLV